MEVILVHDVDRLGLEGEVVRVADGYARNYLLPRKLAVQKTRGSLKDLERRRTSIAGREEHRRTGQSEVGQKLHEYELTILAKSGAEGKLHGSVSAADIVARLHEETGVEVDKSRLELWEPIRQTGSYLITVRLHRDVTPQIVVNVRSDAAPAEAPAEEAAPEVEATEEAEAEAEEAADEEPETEEAE